MSFTLNIPFDIPENHTYGSSVEITGGVGKLKDLVTPFVSTYNGLCAAKFDNDNIGIKLGWTQIGDGSANAFNGAVRSGNTVDLTGYVSGRYIRQNIDGIYPTPQTGCLRWVFIPNYTGYPTQLQWLCCIKGSSIYNNIQLYQYPSGLLRCDFRDQNGSLLGNVSFGTHSFTSGTSYELELNWDMTTGVQRLFIDGIQKGSAGSLTGTRSTNMDYLYWGVDYNGNGQPNYYLDKCVLFSTVQHTANYTITDWSEIPGATYDYDNPTILINASWYIEALEGFTETSKVTGSDAISYLLHKDTADYYYSGGWIESDGTYPQSTSAADIETNKAAFTTERILFGIKLFLHSADGTTTPEIDLLAIDYNYGGEAQDAIGTCIVWGYSIDAAGAANTDPITFELSKNAVEYKTNTIIKKSIITATPDSDDGYFETELIENENMTAGTQYKVTINSKIGHITVPNEATKKLNDLLGF